MSVDLAGNAPQMPTSTPKREEEPKRLFARDLGSPRIADEFEGGIHSPAIRRAGRSEPTRRVVISIENSDQNLNTTVIKEVRVEEDVKSLWFSVKTQASYQIGKEVFQSLIGDFKSVISEREYFNGDIDFEGFLEYEEPIMSSEVSLDALHHDLQLIREKFENELGIEEVAKAVIDFFARPASAKSDGVLDTGMVFGDSAEEVSKNIVNTIFDNVKLHLDGSAFPIFGNTQIVEIIQHGKIDKNQWLNRESDNITPFEWIRDHYAHWIPGLTQAHLKDADQSLWSELQGQISDARRGLIKIPDWFIVPNDKDARLLQITDPEKLKAVLKRRERDRIAQAKRSEKKKASPVRLIGSMSPH